MATSNNGSYLEGNSTMRPPLFNGSNYNYWKTRMMIYLQFKDYNLWEAVVNGPHVRTTIIVEKLSLLD